MEVSFLEVSFSIFNLLNLASFYCYKLPNFERIIRLLFTLDPTVRFNIMSMSQKVIKSGQNRWRPYLIIDSWFKILGWNLVLFLTFEIKVRSCWMKFLIASRCESEAPKHQIIGHKWQGKVCRSVSSNIWTL